MKLTAKTKPRRLTLSQMWKLYMADTGTETPESIIRTLDIAYPQIVREGVNVGIKIIKYRQVQEQVEVFRGLLQGMVTNGDK